jgi:hypothetical protein
VVVGLWLLIANRRSSRRGRSKKHYFRLNGHPAVVVDVPTDWAVANDGRSDEGEAATLQVFTHPIG